MLLSPQILRLERSQPLLGPPFFHSFSISQPYKVHNVHDGFQQRARYIYYHDCLCVPQPADELSNASNPTPNPTLPMTSFKFQVSALPSEKAPSSYVLLSSKQIPSSNIHKSFWHSQMEHSQRLTLVI